MSETGRPDPASLGPLPSEKLLALSDVLKQHAVPHAFGGAIALFYYRDPRSTTDIDINIFLPPSRQKEVVEALQTLYSLDAEQIGVAITTTGQARSVWDVTYVDLFFADTEFHAAMSRRVRREPFLGTEISVLSAEDLLVCKMLFDRPKDWLDIHAVVAAQGDGLDRAYIEAALELFVDTTDHRFVRWHDATAGR